MASSGVKAVMMREKDMPAAALLKTAKKLSHKFKKYDTKLLINDRLDIAMLSDSNGIHSASSGISNADIRLHSKALLTGRSVHTLNEALKAEKEGFDYILFGPVFRTPAKIKYGKPQGIKKLENICSAVKIPVFAVGGITPGRVKKCIIAGAYGVAGIREFMRAENTRKIVKAFMKELPGELK